MWTSSTAAGCLDSRLEQCLWARLYGEWEPLDLKPDKEGDLQREDLERYDRSDLLETTDRAPRAEIGTGHNLDGGTV